MNIQFDQTKLKIVPIGDIHPNAYNPKEKKTVEYGKIKKSIELHGQRLPIIVREKDGFEIIDGEQKYTACLELGFGNVLIYNEGKMSDQQAKELTIAYQQQVPFDELKLSQLVNSMVVDYGNEIKIPFTEIELKNIDNLANYDWEKPPTQNDEWEGMPHFEKPSDEIKVHVSFENENDRAKFMDKIGATIINKTMGNIWCIWYPEKEKDDVKSIRIE